MQGSCEIHFFQHWDIAEWTEQKTKADVLRQQGIYKHFTASLHRVFDLQKIYFGRSITLKLKIHSFVRFQPSAKVRVYGVLFV